MRPTVRQPKLHGVFDESEKSRSCISSSSSGSAYINVDTNVNQNHSNNDSINDRGG